MNEGLGRNRGKRRPRRYLSVAALMMLFLLGTVAFWPRRPLSHAERKVQDWLGNPSQIDASGELVGSNRFADFGMDTIPYLVTVLTNRSSRAEQVGSDVAMKMGPNVYWRLPVWLRRFLTPFRSVENDRVEAAIALEYLPERSAVVAALVPLLQDSRDIVRARVAMVLCERTTRNDTNWPPVLVEAVERETNAAIQVELAWAIGRIETNQIVALSLLRGKTNDPDRFVRGLAARALNDISTGGGQSQ